MPDELLCALGVDEDSDDETYSEGFSNDIEDE